MTIKSSFKRPIYYRLSQIFGSEGLQKPSKINKPPIHPLQNPTHIHTIRAPDDLMKAHSVKIKGNYAFVTGNHTNSLCVFDVSDVNKLQLVGSVSGKELYGAHDVVLADNTAFVSCQQGGKITAVDIRTPSTPNIIATLEHSSLSGVKRVYLDDEILYCAASEAGLVTAVDVGNPTNLHVLSWFDPENKFQISAKGTPSPEDVIKNGDNLFVSDCNLGYYALDISSTEMYPTSIVSNEKLDGAKNSVIDNRGIAYVAAGKAKCAAVVDVTDPKNISVIASIAPADEWKPSRLLPAHKSDGKPLDVELDSPFNPQYLYVTSWLDQLDVIDISDPKQPERVSWTSSYFDLKDPQYTQYQDGSLYIASDVSDCLSIVSEFT